jgi:ABC-type multidrug transport system fused ATPase/permease subunit
VSSILPVASSTTLRREATGILRAERRSLALVLGFQIVAVLAGLVGPQVLARIINDAQAGSTLSAVDYLAGFFLACLIVQSVMTGLTRRRAAVLGERVLAGLRERFVESVLELPLGTVERAGTGDLLTRASTDVDQLSSSMRYSVPEITIAIVQALLTIGALIYTAPILGLTLVPVLIIVSISTRWYLKRAPEGYRRTMASWTKAIATVQESVSAGRTIEAFRLGPRRVAKSEEDLQEWLATEKYTLRLRTIFFPTTEVAYLFPLVLTVLGGGLLHDAGKLSVGAAAAAAIYAQLLIDPVDAVVSWLDELQLGSASFARLLGVREVDAPPLTDEVPGGETVEAKTVRFAYREGRDVLNGIDLSLEPGDRLAVVGPSGAGKSTIALLLAGVHPPRTGTVEIGGVEASRLPPAQLREEIALLTQENHVFAGTLRDNLSLVAPNAGDEELWRALRAVDAEEWAAALPDGLDSDLGPLGSPLTPAKAQQLALARLVLADPHTLVLDEATSLLDPRASRQLERSLGRLLEGRTVVSIAHRLYSAHDADRVAVVDSGRIVEHGTHAELLAAGGTYASLWHSWQGVPDAGAGGGSVLAGGS